jgi:hypothetical protein
MTIADYLIKCLNNGHLRSDRTSLVRGMGETWKFVPDYKYGPGILVNTITGNILSVAEISDRQIDFNNNDWEVVHN